MTERSPPPVPREPIDPALWDAYRRTDYVVDAPDGEIVLRVEAASDALTALMRALRTHTAAVLTAHNPWSEARAADENDAAQRALEGELSERGIAMLPASGRDPGGAWPAETSVLAFGLSRESAAALARRYGQNAFVWVPKPGAACQLLATRPVG
ncbi:MAG: DUF3293 domain-containing protein, partial [Burkholderiales bacterium]